jgi:2-haloacid dehalogenase
VNQRDKPELAIVFDFGGVLVDWNLYYLYRKLFPDDESIEQFLQEVHFRDYNYEKDKGRPYADICNELCQKFPHYEAPLRAYETRWMETIGGSIEPVVEILKTLKESGKTLCGLSNWDADAFVSVRQRYEFFDWFDTIIISGEEGTAKPDERIYQILLERTGRKPGDCLFIDDTRVNIEAAQKLGFQTIWYRDPEQLRRELSERGLLNGHS